MTDYHCKIGRIKTKRGGADIFLIDGINSEFPKLRKNFTKDLSMGEVVCAGYYVSYKAGTRCNWANVDGAYVSSHRGGISTLEHELNVAHMEKI